MPRPRRRPTTPRLRLGSRPYSSAVFHSLRGRIVIIFMIVFLGAWWSVHTAASAAPSMVMTPNPPSAQPVGATITWTAAEAKVKNPVYQFSVAYANGPFSVVRDFDRAPSFTWTPMQEGAYRIRGSVKAGFVAGIGGDVTTTFAVTSRITGKDAVVSATANPLVALYSAPACAGGAMVVQFRPAAGSTAWQSTAAQPCKVGQNLNVLVAGMRPSTAYVLRHVVSTDTAGTPSAPLSFTTGRPPVGLRIATFTVKQAPSAQADLKSPVIFHMLNPDPSPTLANPLATDLGGNLVWYYDTQRSGLTEIWPTRVLSGGTFLIYGRDRSRTTGDDVFREVDLAGDTVRETTIDAVNAQLAGRGQSPIYSFHHDALRLPNGYTAVLGAAQKKVADHEVEGDMVVVLDTNLQVTWAWNAFDHLTVPTTLPSGAVACANDGASLCALPDPKAFDWTHANDIGWSAPDGDLTVSLRNLSLLIKIAYQNGHGNGSIVWRLGNGGDFALKSADPSPWFSHQHNAYLVDPGTVVLFDNSNLRCGAVKAAGCQSRGQVYKLDQQHDTATLLFDADLGSFWQALGSAQRLSNGDFTFAGGYAPPSRAVEFRPDGTKVYELDSPLAEYRAYRLGGLSS